MKKIVKFLILILILGALGGLIAYRFLHKEAVIEEDTRPAVTTELPVKRDIENYAEAIGTVSHADEVSVTPKMSGEVEEVLFSLGDRVEAGQPLIRIHSDALKSLGLQVDAARVQMNDAASNLSRIQALYGTGAVPQQQLESAQSAAESTRIAYESAQEQLTLQSGYTTVTAPIAGIISVKSVEMHDMASPAMPICTISGDTGLSVSFGVPESVMKNLRLGDKVELQKGAEPVICVISELGEKLNAGSGLYDCKADVPESVGKDRLPSGSRAKVRMLSDKARNALTVPLRAVSYADGAPYVYVLQEDGTALKTDLVTGLFDDEQIEVLEGLEGSEKVIVTWSREIYSGAAVIDVTEAQAGAGQPADDEKAAGAAEGEGSGK